jgi:hypothetical protein
VLWSNQTHQLRVQRRGFLRVRLTQNGNSRKKIKELIKNPIKMSDTRRGFLRVRLTQNGKSRNWKMSKDCPYIRKWGN